ncbi:MAG TPA: ribonuclease domain-containing protein [Pelomicrobium sp.]|nr:ribonuclease domain-containing protein [Pelomicrobium sp.]
MACSDAGSPSSGETREAAATVAAADLPPQARETLALIRAGGPFPYRKDGSTFMNREGRLPPKPRGYYREYTVPTPGARDRGARRIVTGRDGEAYYTDDHYRSFRRIRE